MIYRFAQLSDIHFGQEAKDGTRVTHELVRDGVLKDCERFVEEHGEAASLIITGDIAYSGLPEEYKTATTWLEQLTSSCGCKETQVLTIPGNHDCNRNQIGYQARLITGNLRAGSPDMVQAMLHNISKDGEVANPFLPKLAAYRAFANGYDCDFESPERPLWIKQFELPGGVALRFIGLNSVQISDAEDGEGKMILGNTQYTFAEEKNAIPIILVHHPLNFFIDKLEASQIIAANARLVMVGHEHLLDIQKSVDGMTKKEHLVIRSGAVNPPEKGGEYKFTYNWLELLCCEVNGAYHLKVKVFPRVWVPQAVTFQPDRNRLGGSDFCEILIACPNLKPVLSSETLSNLTSGSQGTPAYGKSEKPFASPPQAFIPRSDATTMESRPAMVSDSAAFSRLRYLFWRYLDGNQRLTVLVQVKALPESADQQLPQTMEKVALESAKKNGKLHALWETMMPLVPENKRSENPFPL